MSAHKLYSELAKWWSLLSPPEDYVDEVAFFLEALHAESDSNTTQQRTLLELGSGGGSVAFHLKNYFTLTLVDLSPDMLNISRAINPECEHLVGDMRSVRLDRTFDIVFIHDAIDYMITLSDLRQAIETAYIHCKPGGTALFVPDHTCENFEPVTDHEGRDGDGRSLRMMEWTYDPDPSDTTYLTHYIFALREGDSVHVEHDQHECGLFARADWLNLLHEVGFQAEYKVDSFDRDVFIAVKPIS